MDFKQYQEQAAKTAIYDRQFAVNYPILGLAGEAGEVAGKYSKVLRDNKGVLTEEHKQKLADEIGDVLWFIAATCRDLDVQMEDVAKNNIKKLQDRQARNVLSGSGDTR